MIQRTTQADFELIVIGGGIHGLMVATLAAETGHKVVLLEKGEMGAATSNAWFGILHGGLRYLQNFNVSRYRESLRDRRWFLQNTPEHIDILPFLMPLYGKGMKRVSVFRLALKIDALLSWDRNQSTPTNVKLSTGQVLGHEETQAAFPMVQSGGLEGAGLWEEAVVSNIAGLFATLVDQARAKGVEIISQCEVRDLLVEQGVVVGVACHDGEHCEYFAPKVINSAGPWAEDLAAQFDPNYVPQHGMSLAFNLILNRASPSEHAISVSPTDPTRDMLFLYPIDEHSSFAGTSYMPFKGELGSLEIPEQAIAAFIDDINGAIPGFDLKRDEVALQTGGILPTKTRQSIELLERGRVVDHHVDGGPKGLITQIGTKFTTARSAAARVLSMAGL